MKVIICGGRDIADYEALKAAIKRSGFTISEVVSGGARGVDKMGERWADENKTDRVTFHANWGGRSKSAGPHRNSRMARYAEAVIAVWDGKSTGTEDMILKAKRAGLQVHVYLV